MWISLIKCKNPSIILWNYNTLLLLRYISWRKAGPRRFSKYVIIQPWYYYRNLVLYYGCFCSLNESLIYRIFSIKLLCVIRKITGEYINYAFFIDTHSPQNVDSHQLPCFKILNRWWIWIQWMWCDNII